MLTSCGSSNPGLSSSTACSADQAHCLSPLPGPLSLSPPRIPASCRNYTGIYPVPNVVTMLSLECKLEIILLPCCHLCRAPKEWKSLFFLLKIEAFLLCCRNKHHPRGPSVPGAPMCWAVPPPAGHGAGGRAALSVPPHPCDVTAHICLFSFDSLLGPG